MDAQTELIVLKEELGISDIEVNWNDNVLLVNAKDYDVVFAYLCPPYTNLNFSGGELFNFTIQLKTYAEANVGDFVLIFEENWAHEQMRVGLVSGILQNPSEDQYKYEVQEIRICGESTPHPVAYFALEEIFVPGFLRVLTSEEAKNHLRNLAQRIYEEEAKSLEIEKTCCLANVSQVIDKLSSLPTQKIVEETLVLPKQIDSCRMKSNEYED